ncbi:transcriptional regulator [Sinorhizobium fredii]|uniref:transcriptional regulator n=1 Tax=Rhizobium fredii TaxID=380 RepID=UPI003518F980
MAARSIVVVAPDQGLRRSVAFALEVEGYSTECYDALWKAESSSRESFCAIVDDEILKADAQAAQSLRNLGSHVILLVDGLSAVRAHADTIVLTKPFSGSDLLGAVDGLAELAK